MKVHLNQEKIMNEFASQPPSKRPAPLGKLFQGGMMPATSQDVAALIIIDIRSLGLKASEGKAIEKEVREFVFKQINKRVKLKDRSAINLSSSVFGIAIE